MKINTISSSCEIRTSVQWFGDMDIVLMLSIVPKHAHYGSLVTPESERREYLGTYPSRLQECRRGSFDRCHCHPPVLWVPASTHANGREVNDDIRMGVVMLPFTIL